LTGKNSDIIVVDAKYKSCPGPIIELSEAVRKASAGQTVVLLATDPAAPADVEAWVGQVGHRLLQVSKQNDTYEIRIQVR